MSAFAQRLGKQLLSYLLVTVHGAAKHIREFSEWLDRQDSPSLVNGDLPLGAIRAARTIRLILPAWPQSAQLQSSVPFKVPVSLVLLGLGVMTMFCVTLIWDAPQDSLNEPMRLNRTPPLLSIPASGVQTVSHEGEWKYNQEPLDPSSDDELLAGRPQATDISRIEEQPAIETETTKAPVDAVDIVPSHDSQREIEQRESIAPMPALELAAIEDRTACPGTLLRFFVQPLDSRHQIGDLEYNLSFDAPAGAAINSRSGLFTWRPTPDQAAREYTITVHVHDSANPVLRAETRFGVAVSPVEESVVDAEQPAITEAVEVQKHETDASPAPMPDLPAPAIAPLPPPTSQSVELPPEPNESVVLPPTREEEMNDSPFLPIELMPQSERDDTISNSIGMALVHIPEGDFVMGSDESIEGMTGVDSIESARFDDERPAHAVRISRAFWIGKCEVTVGQFQRFVEVTGYTTDAERDGAGAFAFDAMARKFQWGSGSSWRNPGWSQTDDHPVVNVSWNDAAAFCRWLSAKDGCTYRLPTEAEWEYACRAGSTSPFSSGSGLESLAAAANLGDESFRQNVRSGYSQVVMLAGRHGPRFTTAVGTFQPNLFGLHDMHGNVFEWCADWYAADYYHSSPLIDPLGPEAGTKRVIRGGSFYNSPFYSRSSFRNGFAPHVRVPYLGFRVVRESEHSKPVE